MKKTNEELQEYLKFSKDPLYFIEVMWGLVPQPVKPEFQQVVQDYIAKKQYDEIRGKHFQTFLKGKHITWQQWLFIKAVKDAVNGVGKRRISVASGHGCHAKGTKILMYDGTVKNVEDVVVDDKLMGDDSKPRSVLSLARGKEQLYRVQYFSGEYYDVNESHILSLVASQSHGRQIRGEKQDVCLKDYLEWSERKQRTNIGYKTSVLFNNDKKSNLLIDPYLLGVWLGDGSSNAGIITNPDEEIAEYIFSIKDAHFNKENSSGCPSISVPGLLKELREIKVFNNKHIPHEYLTASYSQRMELLAGLLDTDGYNNGGGCFEIIQKRKILAEQIVFLARSVGCHATIKKVSKGCQNNFVGEYWLVTISRNTWNIPTKISRKQIQKPTKPQREQLNFGFKIVPLEVDNYYGFELDGNGRYLLGDFTVTHNTGKSCTLAMILIWFLYSHYLSQIACTAPSKEQMYDVLWKELSRWISALPPRIKNQFEIQTSHIRIVEKPMEWFARAKTAKKDAPEALAGVHGDDVLLLVDEASGVADEIYETAEGSMTNENYVMILISNPTRLDGKFFKSHNDEIIKHRWQRFTFNSEESPVVEADYCLRKLEENNNNRDADDYRIRVRGIFPRADSVDDKGYTALLTPTDVREIPDVANQDFISPVLLGIDPAGEGCFDDKTEILTDNGFKLFKELTGKEKVLSLNIQKDLAEWNNIDNIVSYKFNGNLNLLEGSHGVNFCITDKHNLVVKTRSNKDYWNKWHLKQFNELPRIFKIKRDNSWKGKNPNIIKFNGKTQPNGGIYKKWKFSFKLWAEFLGWFVSEGSVYLDKRGHYNISIAQSITANKEKRKKIKELLDKMNVGYKECKNDFQFTNEAIGKHLLEHCKKHAHNKRIPTYIKEAKSDIIRIFLDSFALGDGSKRKNGGNFYYSTSKLLMDDLQECLVKLGLSGKLIKRTLAGSKFYMGEREVVRKYDCYLLTENKRKTDGYGDLNKIKKVPYNGKVYCVGVENKTILVRRNGVTMWSGNSNKTTWVIRDRFKAKVVLREEVSNEKKIAQKTLTLMEVFKVKADNIWVDNFGTGANVAKELALAGVSVNGINVGDRCLREKDREVYLNVRAQNYFRLKSWMRSGGELIQDKVWQEQFKSIRFRRALSGKIQIMSKLDMRRAGYNSPDEVDALMLTFTKEDNGGPVRTITGSGQVINHDQGLTLANSQQKENLSVFDAI